MLRPCVQRHKYFDCNTADDGFNSNQVIISLLSNLSACNISKGNCEIKCLLKSDEIDVDFSSESDDDLSERQKSNINHLLFEFHDMFSNKQGLNK